MKKLNSIPFKGMISFSRLSFIMTLVMLVSAFEVFAQTTYYVNDNSLAGDIGSWSVGSNANNGLSMSTPKLTIQAAINAASSGDIILVSAGNYINNIAVTKTLTIRGVNYSSDAPTRGPTASGESIITGARAVITIAANNVVIDGFKLVPTSSRMIENPNGTGLTLKNNVVIVNGDRNPTYGILDCRTNNISGLTISHNLFQCTTGTGGFIPIYMVRATGNLVADNVWITQNSFVNTAHGIYMDRMNVGSMNDIHIQENTFSNIQGVSTGTTGGGRAILANGLNNMHIYRNTFNNVYYFGVQLGASNGEVSENYFTGTSISGVRTITSLGNLSVTNNNFSGTFSQKAIVHGVGTGTLVATCNWFGSNVTTNVTNSVSATGTGTVTTLPWLMSGADGDASTGFQATIGSCTGGQSNPLAITSVYAEDIYCSGTGSVDITFDGGTAPFNISWPGGSENDISSPYTISALPAGTHTITITDANGSVTGNVTLTEKKVYNVSWGIGYSSIQAAITAASPGDILTLCNGTYTENLTIDKAIEIYGPNSMLNDVNATRNEEAVITAASNNPLITVQSGVSSYTINGVRLVGADYSDNSKGRIIWASGNNTVSNILNNILEVSSAISGEKRYIWLGPSGSVSSGNPYISGNIANNLFKGSGTGNEFNGICMQQWSKNFNITGNKFDGMKGDHNLLIWHPTPSVVVSNNEFNRSDDAGDMIFIGGPKPTVETGGITIQNNTFNSPGKGILIFSGGSLSSTISNNNFQNVSGMAIETLSDFAVTATCNWWGSTSYNTVKTKLSGNSIIYSPWLVSGTDNQTSVLGFQPATGTCTGTIPAITSIVATPALCNNVIGSLAVTFSSGTGPYTIQLNSETAIPNATSPYTFSNLADGTYTVTITDANSSSVTSTSVIEFKPVYVKTSSSTLTGYSTIAAAISGASHGDTLFVCPGTYAENITINKRLDVRGPNYGVSPNSGTRSAEAILVPASTNTTTGAVVTITSGNVSFNGFTVNGDNTLLTSSGVGLGDTYGTSIDAARAIFLNGDSIRNVSIANNIAMNAANGIRIEQTTNYFASGSSAKYSFGISINDNKVQNMTSTGIRLGNSMFAKVTNNSIINADNGIAFSSFRIKDNGNAADRVISNNTISARYAGIWVNLYHTSPYVLSNNTITVAPAATSMAPTPQTRTSWFGIMYSTVSCPQNFTTQTNLPKVTTPESWSCSNNTINGSALEESSNGYGYWLYYVDNNRDDLSVDHFGEITGGTVSNVDFGIMLKNKDADPATAFGTAAVGAHASLNNITFNLASGGTAIKLIDDATWTTTNPAPLINKRDVKLTLGSNIVINGGANGLVIEHPATGTANYTAYNSIPSGDLGNMSFATQTGNYISLTNHPNNLTATSVTFEGNTGANSTVAQNWDIENKILHKTDATTKGFVRVKTNNVFVTGNSGSIQRGIDIASAGEEVHVGSGDYTENITVNKNLSLFGANAGTAGNATRVAESKILNSTVTLSGSNAILMDGFNVYQTGTPATTVSLVDGSTPVILRNNIIERVGSTTSSTAKGIELASSTASKQILNNLFRGDNSANLYSNNKTWNSAIYSNGGNVSITYNEFNNCRTAINSDNTTSSVVIDNNTFGTNGTAVTLGGATATTGSYTISGNNFNTPNTILNLANVNANFRLDATNNNFNGVAAASLTLTQAFDVENQLYHKGRGGNKYGLVRIQANQMFNTATTTIANNIAYANVNDVVHLAPITFTEDVDINKTITLSGSGIDQTYVSGPKGGNAQTIKVQAANVVVEKMTVTRDGNNLTDWNDGTLNSAGIAVQSLTNFAEVRGCKITGNRTGIDINNSNGNNIHDNLIDNNRTGLIFRNQTDNTNVSNNHITNNWTVGILFLDASAGTNSPVQTALTSTFNNNNISGNWYAQVEDRQTGGSLPSPGTNLKNFNCNWYGNTAVTATNSTAGEPSYSSQIPVAFGGTSVAPAQAAKFVCGVGVDNLSYNPWLISGTDDDLVALGFQTSANCTGNIINISISQLDTAIYCKDETRGYLEFDIVGGIAPYTISVNGISIVYPNSSTHYVNDTLPKGTYTVLLTDSIGSVDSITFTVTEPDSILYLTATPNHPQCFGDQGTITFEAKGGTNPISVDISGAVYGSAGNQTFASGTYTVLATDANNCSISTDVILNEAPNQLLFDDSTYSVNATCSGLNGKLNFNATGGTGTIAYSLTKDINEPFVLVSSPIDTLAGTYIIKAVDANNCSVTTLLTIDQPLTITVNISNLQHANCYGEDGAFDFKGIGGNAIDSSGFTYSINSIAYTPDMQFNGPTGTYTVVATDITNSCSATAVATINEPAQLLLTASAVDAICFGTNGKLSFSAVGGTGALSYDVNGNVFGSSVDSMSNPSGSYYIVVTDANFCTAETTVEIVEPTTSVSFVSDSTFAITPACYGGSGQISFLADGGTGAIAYMVDGVSSISPFTTTTGTYAVVATDANGCTASTNIFMDTPTPVTFDLVTPTHLTCFANASGELNFNAIGGTGGISYAINGVTNFPPTTGLAAGSYTITANDENNCSIDSIVVITEPDSITISQNVSNVLCLGGTGSVSFSAVGGTGAISFTFDGTNAISPVTANAGTYVLTATDANSCLYNVDVTIAEPATAVNFTTTSSTDAACKNAAGTLLFVANGGTGSITYFVNTDTVLSPLSKSAGIYTVVASDENGCTASTTLTINEPDVLSYSTASATNALCNGINGSLSFDVTGGTGTITYTVNGTTSTSTSSQAAGTYTVVATDANACSLSTTLVITEPSAVSLTASKTDALCNASNGSLTFSATGGTGAIDITVNGTVQISPFATSAGTYTVVAADANGCSTSTTLTIDEPSSIVLTTSSTNAPCNAANGSLIFNATGGSGTLNYTVNTATQGSPYAVGAGTYTVQVTDANNCSKTSVLTITQPDVLTYSTASATNALCNGINGSLSFDVTGGTGTITYTVNGTTSTSTSSQAAGTYTVVATDANACSLSTTLVITEPSAVSLTASKTDALCNASNGSLTFSATGGTGAIDITVNGTVQISPFATSAGTYTVVAADANGCSTSTTLTIDEPSSIVLTTSSTNAPCNAANGSLIFNATGGSGTLNYTVNTATQGSPYAVGAGTYTVQVTDANNCSKTSVLTITQPDVLTYSTASATNALCNGINGSLSFDVTGGTGTITYTVNGTTSTSPSSQAAGTYTVVATDANACSLSITLVITEPSAVSLTASKTDALCNASNGSLTFSATGGTGAIDITVNGTVQSSPFATAAGTYTVVAADANGCSTSTTLTIDEPSSIVLTTSSTNAPCNAANGSLIFNATGGSGTLNYTVNTATQGSPYAVGAGTYTVQVTDANNCSKTSVLTITQPDVLTYSTASATNALCNGINGSLSFDVTGGTGTITYTVNGTTSTSPSSQAAGTYTVVATDANACSLSTTLVITEPSAVSLTASKTNPSCNGGNGSLTFSATGGTGAIGYTVNTVAQSSPFAATSGMYTVVASDINGCTSSSTLEVGQPSAVVFTASTTNALCNGLNGQLSFNATGGTGSIVYTLGSDVVSSPVNKLAGTYTVTATDANGCTVTTSMVITEPNTLTLSASKSNALCFGANGSLTFSGNGGTTPYSLKVNGSVQASPFTAAAGNYTVSVSDANNCSASTTIEVTQPSLITTTDVVTSCHSYKWTVNNVTYTTSGSRSVVLSAINGCDSVVNLDLTIVPYTLIADTVVAFQTYTWRGNTYTLTGTYYDTTGVPSCTARTLLLTITTCAKPTLNAEVTAELTSTLSWTGTSAPNYRVEYSIAGANSWTTLTTSTSSITLSGLNQNTTYDYRVRALCGLNSISEWSTDSFTTKVIVCNAPTFNATTAVTFNSATVNWSNTGAGSYLLRWKLQGAATWTDSATVTGTQTRNLTGLLSGTTYDISIRSRCLGVVNSTENTSSFTTTARCAKIVYSNRTVTSTSVTLYWSAITSPLTASSYQMNYRGPGMATAQSVSTNITTTNRSKTGLTANTTYTFSVRSNCGNNNLSEWADTVITTPASKTTEEFLTANIVNFEGQASEAGNNLSWSTFNENNCREMVLQHSTNGSEYTDLAHIASLADGGNSNDQLDYGYLHTTPSLGTNYYRLKSMSYDGEKAYHNQIVELTKEVPATNVHVYPNPTKNLVNLDFYANVDNQLHVKVLDMTGRVVKTVHVQINVGQNTVGLGIGEFPQGIYTIQLYQDNQLIHVSKIYRQD